MIQRILYDVVKLGLAQFQTTPALYTNLFGTNWGLSDTEVAGIAAAFMKKPARVTHGYQMADVSPPLVCILLQQESESEYALGDYIGQATFADAAGHSVNAAELGAIWDASFQILNVTENPDLTSYLYEMVKACLVIGKATLQQAGIMDPMLAGTDLAPDSRYMPEHLFVRALTVRCKRQFAVADFDHALSAAIQVGGINVPAASPNDNGGVKTLARVVVNLES